MHGVDTHLGGYREQRRKQDDQRGDGLHEHPHDQQQNVDQKDDQVSIVGQ